MFSGEVVPSVSESVSDDSYRREWDACNAGRSVPELYRNRLDAWNEIKELINSKKESMRCP